MNNLSVIKLLYFGFVGMAVSALLPSFIYADIFETFRTVQRMNGKWNHEIIRIYAVAEKANEQEALEKKLGKLEQDLAALEAKHSLMPTNILTQATSPGTNSVMSALATNQISSTFLVSPATDKAPKPLIEEKK